MSDIKDRFLSKKLLIPYIMGGWPDIPTSAEVFKIFAKLGCPVIEIGIPYSDPLADGPTIQRAAEASLAGGTTTDKVFSMIAEVTAKVDVSPVLMVYYNLVYRYGIKRFAQKASEIGVKGVIIPDLTIEESDEWHQAATDCDIDPIFLVAPTSSEERLEKITKKAAGFIYAVSLTGVTGARTKLPEYLTEFVKNIKSKTDVPVAVGFGISQPAQAGEVANYADGVIVGSAIIDVIENSKPEEAMEKVRDFGEQLVSAVNNKQGF